VSTRADHDPFFVVMRWATYTVGALIGLVGISIMGIWVYYDAEPWYDRTVIRQLVSGPRSAPWADTSSEAEKIFPNGMPRGTAATLLQANGFVCEGAKSESDGVHRLSCRRETQAFLCLDRYTVEIGFDGEERVKDRRASVYSACP
jgi:hypothetical protein